MDNTNPMSPAPERPFLAQVQRCPEDIQDEATFRAASIFRSWERLQNILDIHQLTISSRWSRKSTGLKKDILVEAWPDIPLMHRPDFALFHPFNLLQEAITDAKDLAASKWPYINLEDLLKGKFLPVFMEARARNPPRVFARSDLEGTVVNRVMSSFSVSTCPGHSISLAGDSVGTYGNVVSLVGNADAQDRLKYAVDYTISEGLLVLEIQQKVLQFLESCCEGILHDRPLPDPNEGWTTVNDMNKSAPYRAPMSFDFRQLISLLGARLTMTADHLWDLRIDPSYFLETITAYEASTEEAIYDSQGQSDPAAETQDHWDNCAGFIAESAYCNVIMASICFEMSDRLQNTYGNRPKIGQIPSQSSDHFGLLEGMLRLRHTLVVLYEIAVDSLSRCLPTERTFRKYFVKDSSGTTLRLVWTRPSERTHDRLFALLSAFVFVEEGLESQMGRKNLLVEIERLLESDPSEKMRLSPRLLMMISDAGFYLSAVEAIDLVQPSVPTVYAEMETDEGKEGDASTLLSREVAIELRRHTQFKDDVQGMSYEGFGPPNSGRFDYPCWKTRTLQSIDQMRRAEKCLDEYWEMFDHNFHSSCSKSIHDYDPQVFKCRQINRQHEPKPKHKTKDSGVALDDIDTALAQLDKPKESDEAAGVLFSETNLHTNGTMPIQDFLAIHPAHFTFTERSLKVFRKMFSTPSPDPPGEIKWKDFLNAMVDSGFQITKQYGSLWLFTPVSLGAEKSIFLQEPPLEYDARSGVLQMDFKIAQRLARRLNYAYGWDESWFTQK
ncbi:hypothetical protein BKA61DRAFT_49360 [Leptodontidium sp. MPI-SDFR-AT-0119]|nr:hypothetical protein BKA61DRAFT_49360 [Leptodontidium sp. MPI-SDFR-AT-0119]